MGQNNLLAFHKRVHDASRAFGEASSKLHNINTNMSDSELVEVARTYIAAKEEWKKISWASDQHRGPFPKTAKRALKEKRYVVCRSRMHSYFQLVEREGEFYENQVLVFSCRKAKYQPKISVEVYYDNECKMQFREVE